VDVINDAHSAHIYWIVEGAVSMGASSHMEGTILGNAAIAFGASSTLNGRLMAGTDAGTIAIDTDISAVTGNPPDGGPPPVLVAETLTDADGNYLFKGVEPGTYMVRWDLSGLTGDYQITSDGVFGDADGFVSTGGIEILAGTAHLSMDLGLAETLSAIKAAALEELATALETYEEADYTEENWTALNTAKTDGDLAIQEAADPEAVAEAKDAALAAMDSVQTFIEPPVFTDITLSSEGEVTLELSTVPHYHLTLQTSTDLQSWTTIATATPDSDFWTFIHTAELAIGPWRFYRAFITP